MMNLVYRSNSLVATANTGYLFASWNGVDWSSSNSGGVTMNGSKIYEEAVADIKELKETWQLKYEEPVDLFIG